MATGKRRQARRAAAATAPAPGKKSGVTKKLLALPEKTKTPARTPAAPTPARIPEPAITKTPDPPAPMRRWPCPRDMTRAELKSALSDTKSRLKAVERRLQVFIELVRHELDKPRGPCKHAIKDYCDIETRHQREREDERQRHNARVVKYYEWLQQQQGDTP